MQVWTRANRYTPKDHFTAVGVVRPRIMIWFWSGEVHDGSNESQTLKAMTMVEAVAERKSKVIVMTGAEFAEKCGDKHAVIPPRRVQFITIVWG